MAPSKPQYNRKLPETDELPSTDDRKRFDHIFRSYVPRLLAYGELFTDKDTAQDIVQDLMVYIYDNAETLVIHTSLEAYLFKAVYLRCLNHIKRNKVQRDYYQHNSEDRAGNETDYYDPDQNEIIRKIYSSELRTELINAINELPLKCREAFIKSYIHEMKARDIAAELNISERTVNSHVYAALKFLRARLKDKIFLLFPLYL